MGWKSFLHSSACQEQVIVNLTPMAGKETSPPPPKKKYIRKISNKLNK